MLKQDQENTSRLNKFNSALIQSIEETIEYIFGENTKDNFFETLSLNGCSKSDIPIEPGLFRDSVYSAFPSFIHTPVPLFLRVILKRLSENLNLEYDKERSYHFAPYFYELRENYLQFSGGDIS